MRFYLDEMYPPALARSLRTRGVDTISALDHNPASTTDATHLQTAASDSRAVVTNNFDDFIRLTDEFFKRGERHAGVVLVPNSFSAQQLGPLIAALVAFAHEHPAGLPPYTVVWLRHVPYAA